MSSRLALIDSLDGDKSFSSLGNIVADAVGIKTSVKVITGTKEIGQVIYTETPPSGTTFAITDSQSLNFDAFSEDSVVADVQPVKIVPTVTYHAAMEYHENSSIEDLVYSSELG